MTANPDEPRTHANAGSGACVADSADSVVGTDAARSAAADGDVIGVDPGTRADRVARPADDDSNDADRHWPAPGRPGAIGQPTTHTHRSNSFQ
jgi:hypothetical protein